jgi:hypothetical protein
MSNRVTTPRIDRPRSFADAMHDPALAEFASEREMSEREKTVATTTNTPVTAAVVRTRRKAGWVGIVALVFGLLLVAVCLYSALTDPPATSDAGAPPQPITSRSQHANR